VLYDTGNPVAYSSDAFLKSICHLARSTFGSKVSVSIGSAEGELAASTAMPLALILNELLTNAVKHGIADRQRGSILVSLISGEDQVDLVVQDDGPGFKCMEIPIGTCGLGLVTGLARQLGGSLTIEDREGACCTVRFPAAGAA
jgi:two-component sensor histidine kinase